MRHLAGGLMLVGSLVLATMMGVAGGAWAQAQDGPANANALTAEEIAVRMMARNAERQRALEHYVAERTYRVEYKGAGGAHTGAMAVHLEYASGQKRLTVVSEEGSKLICERVLRKLVESEEEASQGANQMQTMVSPESYNLELAGEETLDGIRTWVLKVSPKVESKFTYRGRVWVAENDYAIVRVLGEPAKNPSWWISRASFDWRYEKKGEFWLPESNVARSHVRMGGDATLTIEYGAYSDTGSEGGKAGGWGDGCSRAENFTCLRDLGCDDGPVGGCRGSRA
jgi:hypothetical protein